MVVNNHTSLHGLSPEALLRLIQDSIPSCSIPTFRGNQLFSWIQRGVTSFDQMTNIPARDRALLTEAFGGIFTSEVIRSVEDPDGTVKQVVRLHDGNLIECVLLTDERGRKTACVSSQVGCAMGCTFCRTAHMGFIRDLSAGEIVEQFHHLRASYGDITHIVYMGMGEPLMNFEAVRTSVMILNDERGVNISYRRMTLSTCGIIPGILTLAQQGPPVRLAISLTSAQDQLRERLMPITRKYSLPALRAALQKYGERVQRRITLEYVLLKDVNDREEDIDALAAFCQGLQVIVNIIPWNPASEIAFQEPTSSQTTWFCTSLEERGINVTRRFRRGRGVNGACGQLATQRADRS